MRSRDTKRQGRMHGAPQAHAAASAGSSLGALQRLADDSPAVQRLAVIQAKGGLPSDLAAGVEALSGMDVSDVRVHYNSSRPATLQAHAYAKGSDIHLAPGQEKHLPHEAWHVVQQRQGRVRPTMDLDGTPVNDDPALEAEADSMGGRALSAQPASDVRQREAIGGPVAQLRGGNGQRGGGQRGGGQRGGGQQQAAFLSDTQRTHILVGDHNGGGHKFGAGKGKSEFPQDWKNRDIVNAVKETANKGALVRTDDNGRQIRQKTVNGVTVKVVVTRDGAIITGYPL
jgi:hypothetical protein